jgi:hypothetical protein
MRRNGAGRHLTLHLSWSMFCCVAVAQMAQQSTPAYWDSKLPAAVRAHDLVSRMTLEEKTSQLEEWALPIQRPGVRGYHSAPHSRWKHKEKSEGDFAVQGSAPLPK